MGPDVSCLRLCIEKMQDADPGCARLAREELQEVLAEYRPRPDLRKVIGIRIDAVGGKLLLDDGSAVGPVDLHTSAGRIPGVTGWTACGDIQGPTREG